MREFVPQGLGWRPDLPDFRDLRRSSPQIAELLERYTKKPGRRRRRAAIDLREFFAPARDQQPLNSSSVHACTALLEYYERRAFGRIVRPSRLFLYKTARELSGLSGDAGADLRSTLKALVRFGMPPEQYWPYEPDRFDEEPRAFHYGFAAEYRDIRYVRLDEADGPETLDAVRSFLDAGFPCAFGFPVPSSLSMEPEILWRPTFDDVIGGQAAVAVGYDDGRLHATRGALLVRSSWGAQWGDAGYGWLPYAFVEQRLAIDFWTLVRPGWIEHGEFQRPR
ncbi:MAG: C1 family peptidase [Planctomycetes bacterium]|nr:C1 family peptidase [Planctomycetota bacterium]